MPAVTWGRSLLAGVTVIAAGAFVVHRYHLLDRGTTTPVSLEATRNSFQQATVAPSTSSPATSVPTRPTTPGSVTPTTLSPTTQLPALGVYVYDTTGKDSVDALAGSHHDYPPMTTITVTSSACGVIQRWDVLVERWEQWDRCAEPGTMVETGRVTFDTFFGRSQTDTYVCTGSGRPVDAPAGTVWSATCSQGDEVEVRDGVVVGAETTTVGTISVATEHVRVTVADGTPSDTQVTDTWYQVGTDLVVAQTGSAATTNASPVGPVHYAEQYEIHLTSLTPLT